jgi:hypothetical protein
MAEKDVEKASSHAPEDTATEDVDFEPIQSNSPYGHPRAGSISQSLRSLSRQRSNNGYGVDDSEDTQEQSPQEKDPYEVGWDGGDNDPMCPRKFGNVRKWVIVLIVSFASLCVCVPTPSTREDESLFH